MLKYDFILGRRHPSSRVLCKCVPQLSRATGVPKFLLCRVQSSLLALVESHVWLKFHLVRQSLPSTFSFSPAQPPFILVPLMLNGDYHATLPFVPELYGTNTSPLFCSSLFQAPVAHGTLVWTSKYWLPMLKHHCMCLSLLIKLHPK